MRVPSGALLAYLVAGNATGCFVGNRAADNATYAQGGRSASSSSGLRATTLVAVPLDDMLVTQIEGSESGRIATIRGPEGRQHRVRRGSYIGMPKAGTGMLRDERTGEMREAVASVNWLVLHVREGSVLLQWQNPLDDDEAPILVELELGRRGAVPASRALGR